MTHCCWKHSFVICTEQCTILCHQIHMTSGRFFTISPIFFGNEHSLLFYPRFSLFDPCLLVSKNRGNMACHYSNQYRCSHDQLIHFKNTNVQTSMSISPVSTNSYTFTMNTNKFLLCERIVFGNDLKKRSSC